MSLQRARPIDTLQKVISTFKNFEKKLDKLQEDVSYHGHALTDLRVMVANLSAGTMMATNIHNDLIRRPVNNTAIQYDERFYFEEPAKVKGKKANLISSKITAKRLLKHNYGIKPIKDSTYRLNKIPSNSKSTGKHFIRYRKAEAPRKATTLRTQK